jgi:ribosomal protein S18 acetylase RimI-like enzyme
VRYELRRVGEGDKEWLYELKADAYRDVVERQFGSWDDRLQRQMFDEAWKPEAARIISVDQADVGLVVVDEREDELWLAEIQLSNAARNRGLGSTIIRDLLERAHTAAKPLLLQVLHGNYRAMQLYERLGFLHARTTHTHNVMRAT